MKKILIEGQKELTGTIEISGSKNSAVALIPAAILCDDEATIYNVPNISDTKNLIDILNLLGCEVDFCNDTIKINNKNIHNELIEEELSKKLRASYYFMGCLLSKFHKAVMYFPGGCKIGTRPIDIHIKGFKKLGATVTIEGNKYTIEAKELIGNKIYLDFASVGATINIMFAAVKAKGTTVIENAAKEPEIVNIATFLNNMGAKISGAGTSKIIVEGVSELKQGTIENIPDRIEAGTYIIIGSLIGKDLKIKGVIKEHLGALFSKLNEIGVPYEVNGNSIIVSRGNNYLPVNIKTLVYPGFPTDLGQPISVLLTECQGKSIFEETIYENRKGHVDYLKKMGADMNIENQKIIIIGPSDLQGSDVTSTDLRAGAALVEAGLIAKGTTIISDIEHVLRGYENIVEKLSNVGASIKIIDE